MKVCPKCKKQYENGNFCENCENEDGTPVRLEEEKVSCPQCGRTYNVGTKFCSECGVKLGTGGTSNPINNSGISMGDKNVIAGDVTGKKETYHVSGNATIVHNDDETKKTAKCHICGSIIQRIEGYDCPDCGQFTCSDCFDRQEGVCRNCSAEHVKNKEQQYKMKVIEFLGNDNRIDQTEFAALENLAAELKISSFRAMELQQEVRNNATVKEMTTFEKLNFDKALELYYEEGKTKEALKLLEPIYNDHMEDEKVLDLYLPVLAADDAEKAKEIIHGLKYDIKGAYLTEVFLAIQEKDLATAERKINQAVQIWPEDTLVKCHRILYILALYEYSGDENWLNKAEEFAANLGEAHGKLELSWQVKIQCMVNEAKGEESFEMDEEFCKTNQLYFSFINEGVTLEDKEKINNEKIIEDFIKNSKFSDDGKTLKKYNGNQEKVIIPDSVTEIGADAFRGSTSLSSVTIPNAVTKIGRTAFYGCTSLSSITIPDSVTEIGNFAFSSCTSLASITIPDSVTEIGEGVFQNCKIQELKHKLFHIEHGLCIEDGKLYYSDSSMKSVNIPDSVTEIESSAFNGCTSLSSVTIPNSVTKIGNFAFNACTSLFSITIPDSVTKIGNFAFNACTSLSSITIPDSVTEIGSWAFDSCTSLSEESKKNIRNHGYKI
ncbi:MAG: leucine-rich repeat protein [Treponema sp.]|nr:leucine-rich repeat protein [Treponema sp.]